MASLSVYDLLNPFRGPLTAKEIAVIEEEMDRLLVDMFIANEEWFDSAYEALENDLKLPLPEKMRGYLEIVTRIEQNGEDEAALQIDPRFGENLRALLKLVENYFYALN